jgi:hypothetical protein
MIFATGALIPLEIRHTWHQWLSHRPIWGALLLLLANCFIVWFLYMVLKRDKHPPVPKPERELVETHHV